MAHPLLLGAHVLAGALGLLLGPLALAVPPWTGWRPRLGVAYQAAVAVLTLTALGLVALAPGRLWWLALVAAATETAAVAGWWVRRRQAPGWPARQVRLMGGSYLSLVTAALVVSWASPLAWVLPTLIGAPLIARAVSRADRGDPTPVPPARAGVPT